jgi:hypothetical protein
MSAAALVRLPPELAAAVRSAATAARLTDAAWLRSLAVFAVAGAPTDARPSPPRRALPPEDVVAVAKLREAVGEAVGALVRSAAFARDHSDLTTTRAELELLIPKFRQAAIALDDIKNGLLP